MTRPAERRLHGHGVEDRLQRAAAVDDDVAGEAVLAGLVVGDAPLVAVAAFEQVDHAVQAGAIGQHGLLAPAGLVAAEAAREADADLDAGRRPLRAVAREAADPLVDVAPDRRDGVLPDAQDRRRQAILVLGGHARHDRVGHLLGGGEPIVGERHPGRGHQLPHDLGEHLVHHRPARQRVEDGQRHRLLPRLEAQHRREVELVRAGGKALQCRRRVRPRVQAMRCEHLGRRDEPVVRRPRAREAQVPRHAANDAAPD